MDSKKSSLIAAQILHVYTQHAHAFDQQRDKTLFERTWLNRILHLLPSSPDILDLGCGSGEPIAHHLIQRGANITGIDISVPMLDMCRQRFPQHTWRHMDMREVSFARDFDAIIAWGSFFHLTKEEQRATLPKLAQHLRPTGILLLTVGHEEGEEYGHVNQEQVYHASLSFEEYKLLLHQNNMSIRAFVAQDPTCNHHTILVAVKR